jgi:hypothetical protein
MEPSIADIVANKVKEETERFQSRDSTPSELTALEILERCYRYRSLGDASETFSLPKLPARASTRPGAPWMIGDLAAGDTGPEFNYAYLPVRFVERLLEVAEEETGDSRMVADILTASATVYLRDNLRQVIDEAITNLFFEASTVLRELKLHLDSVGNTAPEISQRFPEIIKLIISEGDGRRKERLRQAMWEINPRLRLIHLSEYYTEMHQAWREATDVYKSNKQRATWKAIVKNGIRQKRGIELPDDLISLLSSDAADHLVLLPENVEQNPSAFALEHAARLCGVWDFRYSTGYLREVVGSQKANLPE